MVVLPLDFRSAAQFWGISDARLAAMVHAIVGGTPAYRRQFVRDDVPQGVVDFDSWVQRTVLNPRTPLFREARYLLAEETEVRDPALYHSVLAAIAEGNRTRGGIANFIGRKTTDIAHPLTVLVYQAIMRPQWRRLELGQAAEAWRDAKHRFQAQVVGPHSRRCAANTACAREPICSARRRVRSSPGR